MHGVAQVEVGIEARAKTELRAKLKKEQIIQKSRKTIWDENGYEKLMGGLKTSLMKGRDLVSTIVDCLVEDRYHEVLQKKRAETKLKEDGSTNLLPWIERDHGKVKKIDLDRQNAHDREVMIMTKVMTTIDNKKVGAFVLAVDLH